MDTEKPRFVRQSEEEERRGNGRQEPGVRCKLRESVQYCYAVSETMRRYNGSIELLCRS